MEKAESFEQVILSGHDSEGPAVRTRFAINEDRDRQLWNMIGLTCLALCAGFATLFLPDLLGGLDVVRVEGRYLPQLIFGLVTLVALLNTYLMYQQRALRRTRLALMEEAVRGEKALAQSLVDPLTQLFNRRYFDYLIVHETKRSDRLDDGFALLMIDVDGFGVINKTLGHVEGDRALVQVARLLRESFRQSDTIIRFGGDEFLVLLPATDESGAVVAARRLQKVVEEWNARNPRAGYTLGLSCGVAVYSKGVDLDALLACADGRMRQRKSSRHVA